MSNLSSVDNIKMVPVNILWQMEQVETFDFADLTKALLAGNYFKIWAANDAVKYYVWFNTGMSADPAPAGFTEVEVDVSSANTPNALATAVKTALEAVQISMVDQFEGVVVGSILTVKRTIVGETTEALDATAGDATNIIIALSRRGRDYDLGLLEGDVEPNFQPANFIVMAHQYGKQQLAALNQGVEKLEVATTLLETQKSQLESLYKIYGGSGTPTSGTKIFGVGSATLGKNMMVEAGRLVLKPVNAEDDTDNVNFMLALPVPETLKFSGENPRTLKVTWQGFIDRDFNTKFNAIAFGDIFQDGIADA